MFIHNIWDQNLTKLSADAELANYKNEGMSGFLTRRFIAIKEVNWKCRISIASLKYLSEGDMHGN